MPEGDPLARLLARLELEPGGAGAFAAAPVQAGRRLFGGLLAAQAAVAAARTVAGARLHSLHGYFLRPGRPGAALRFEVTRVRDGRRFATRRVLVLQLGEPVFELACGFTGDEQGVAHAHEPPLAPAPPPEGLPDWESLRAAETGEPARPPDAIEVRVCQPADDRPGAPAPPHRLVWMRPRGRLPEDPVLHAAALVYASDRTLLRTAARLHGGLRERLPASLDHAVWLHRPPRWDDWILYASETPIAHGGRAWVAGRILDRSGARLASVVQEGLLRRPRRAGG
ncbi:MAG: thioesterase family protein [Deltaproteobacteria bacterium]|nr:thioesterase family protein [Deltaproteobacteria bacterium]